MNGIDEAIRKQAQPLLEERRQSIYRQTDRWFAWLMVAQWLAGIAAALWIFPQRTTGASGSYLNLWLSAGLGGIICGVPAVLAFLRPGRTSTRYVVAVSQALMSSLLIQLSGGRIEAHFHIFGSLAFLAFYRDWRLLVPATLVAASDHLVRGYLFPQSVFGVADRSLWRGLEHIGWILFTDFFLIKSCIRANLEIEEMAVRQARMEQVNITIEHEVQKRAGELHESETMFRALINNANTGIVISDADGRTVAFNPKAEEIFGWPANEVVGRPITMLLPTQVHANFETAFQEIKGKRLQMPKGAEVIGLRKSGEEFPLGVGLSIWEVGDRAFFSAMFRDISDRKRLENQLEQAHKLESIGQLAAGIAHEINTPIQYVGDNTRFLQDAFNDLLKLSAACDRYFGELDPAAEPSAALKEVSRIRAEVDVDFLQDETPRAIEQTLDGVNRVATIVRAMKEFSHPGPAEKTPTDLNRAIHNATIVSKNEWKYIAEIVEDFDPQLPTVPCLGGEFNQVMLNLIVNAAHAIEDVVTTGTMAKGTITIRTRKDGENIRVDVEDTGSGIAESVRPHIFNLFFTTKDVGRGTGQGLHFAYASITRNHGGQISFQTKVGAGTTFSIWLPLIQMEDSLQ